MTYALLLPADLRALEEHLLTVDFLQRHEDMSYRVRSTRLHEAARGCTRLLTVPQPVSLPSFCSSLLQDIAMYHPFSAAAISRNR